MSLADIASLVIIWTATNYVNKFKSQIAFRLTQMQNAPCANNKFLFKIIRAQDL